ncbi:hypothetical protein DE146DRAFT_768702 [Phaeosphaeria sp. MPI-PUGE-AT-0046c]|nr:hypothetical protein DE146DRAFT_768702 [Phaeosphaeria sp. MPI-PUGE-AT-0046c]
MAESHNHASYLTDLLGHAKKGGKNLKTEDLIATGTSLTAEQIANAQNILGMIAKNNRIQREQSNRKTDDYQSSDIAIDIHGRPSYFNDPVYFSAHNTATARVSGVHYTVSDFNTRCNKSTKYRACDRHRDPRRTNTDISLCKGNHLRMVLSWDVTDPDNRKKSWKLSIEEKYGHFFNPERERRAHEASARRGQEDEGEAEGRQPMDPVSRVKELAQRIIEDHNRDQKDKARCVYLDPKGREYTTKPCRWGNKGPYMPAEAASTRAGYEWQSAADEDRVLRELRVMLQMLYRSKLTQEERGVDRTSERAMGVWKDKMKTSAKKGSKEASFNELGEWIAEGQPVMRKTLKIQVEESFRISTKKEIAVTKARAKEEKIKGGKVEREAPKVIKHLKKSAGKSVKDMRFHEPIIHNSDVPDDDEVLGTPIVQHKILAKVSYGDNSKAYRPSSKPSKAKTVSQEPTTEQVASFEQWAIEVEIGEEKATGPAEEVNELKFQSKTEKRASMVVSTTTCARDLLDAMKQKAAEDVQSEEESEPIPEESDTDEFPTKQEKADPEAKPQNSTSTKMKPTNSPNSSESPTPTPIPKHTKSTILQPETPKRTAITSPDSDLPASKKSRKYKSADIVEDIDDEADYALPEASEPIGSEQYGAWALSEMAISESVEAVQSDERGDVIFPTT